MNMTQIKEKIVSAQSITRLIADSWTRAQSGLCGITDDKYREVPVSQYPLKMLSLVVGGKEKFHSINSSEKELIVERMKAVLASVKPLLDDHADMTLPSYSLVSNLTPRDGETERFNEQLREDFRQMEEQSEADALALTLYAVVYAYYGDFEDGTVKRLLRLYVEEPYDIGNCARMTDGGQTDAAQNVYGAPQTNAYATGKSHRTRKAPGRWLPLKIYLIATTLFVALVVGLVFISMATGAGSSSMSIMDVNGEMVSIEPGMEPVTLFLFGTVGYDSLIFGIKTATVIFIIWRVALTVAVYIFNARRRRLYQP